MPVCPLLSVAVQLVPFVVAVCQVAPPLNDTCSTSPVRKALLIVPVTTFPDVPSFVIKSVAELPLSPLIEVIFNNSAGAVLLIT